MKSILLYKHNTNLIANTGTTNEILKQFADGEIIEVQIKAKQNARSNEQLNLYWACCEFVADNTEDINFNTKEKVDEQCKIHCRYVDYWYTYLNQKTGEQALNIKTKSIATANADHLTATGYFDEAFNYLPEIVKMDKDTFINEVKAQMTTQLVQEIFKGEKI